MYEGKKVNGKHAKKLVANGAMLIDVRDPVAFRDGTLPGSINLSLRQLSTLANKPKTTKIVVFGESDNDITLKSAINYINLYGFTEIYSLGSKDNWNN